MSFREKSAWISLLLYLGIYGFYFAQVAMAVTRGQADGAHFLGLFGQSVVMFVVATIVLTVIAAVLAPRDAQAPQDEREKLIALKANSASGYALAVGVVLAIGAVFYGANEFQTINLLFFALVLSEVYKVAAQIVLTRRGV